MCGLWDGVWSLAEIQTVCIEMAECHLSGSRVPSCGGASLHYFTCLLLVVGDTGLIDVCELLDGFDSGLLHLGHRIFVGAFFLCAFQPSNHLIKFE